MCARILSLSLILGCLFFTMPAIAQLPERGFDVQATLYDGDRLVGNPRIVAREHDEVIVAVPREGGYRLKIKVHGLSRDVLSNAALVETRVEFFRGGQWRDVASPTVRLGEDGWATVRIHAAPGDGNRAFQMKIQVRSRTLAAVETQSIRPSGVVQGGQFPSRTARLR